jgi:hypothetical protein
LQSSRGRIFAPRSGRERRSIGNAEPGDDQGVGYRGFVVVLCMAPMMIDRQAKASPQHRKQGTASSAHVGIGLVLSVMARPPFCRGATDHFRVFAPALQGGAGDATEPATSAEVRIEASRRVIEDLILLWHSSRMMVSASRA